MPVAILSRQKGLSSSQMACGGSKADLPELWRDPKLGLPMQGSSYVIRLGIYSPSASIVFTNEKNIVYPQYILKAIGITKESKDDSSEASADE